MLAATPPKRTGPPRRLPLLIVLGVLLSVLGLFGTDVIARQVMQRVAAGHAQEAMGMPRRPSVHLDGTPFLTQLLHGRFEQIRVELRDGSVCGVRIGHAHVTLRGVRRRSQGVAVDSMVGDGLLTYDDLSRAISPLRVSAGPPGQVQVSGGLGPFAFTALAAPRIEGDSLVIAPISADASTQGGHHFDANLAGFPPIHLRMRKLPQGLAVNLDPSPDGLVLAFTGHDVLLDPPHCSAD
jgi:hypothetical protein